MLKVEPDKGGNVCYFRNVRDSIAIVGITEALIIGEFFAFTTLESFSENKDSQTESVLVS